MLNHSQTSTSVESFAHSKDTQTIHNPRKIFPSNLKRKPIELVMSKVCFFIQWSSFQSNESLASMKINK